MNSVVAVEPTAEQYQLVQYEAAVQAIAACDKVDEAAAWSDRAARMAAYARQAKDDSLRVMAVRIQARAERRMGELMKQIPRGDEATRYGQETPLPPVTRTQAADDAGLSEHERKRALRVASIPEERFNAQVESDNPPTPNQLARQGIQRRTPVVDVEARIALDALRTFGRFCERHEPVALARAVTPDDAETMRALVSTADGWLDRFVANLAADAGAF